MFQFFIVLAALIVAGQASDEPKYIDVVWMPAAERLWFRDHQYLELVFDGIRRRLSSLPNIDAKFAIFPTREDVDNCYEVFQSLASSSEVSNAVKAAPNISSSHLQMVPYWALLEASQNGQHGFRYYVASPSYHSVNPFYVITSTAELQDISLMRTKLHICNEDKTIDYLYTGGRKIYVVAVVPVSEKSKWERQLTELEILHTVYGFEFFGRDYIFPYDLGDKIAYNIANIYASLYSPPQPPEPDPWYIRAWHFYKRYEELTYPWDLLF